MIQGAEMAAAPAPADPEPASWPKATPTYPQIIRRTFLASAPSPGTQPRFEASVKQGSFENLRVARAYLEATSEKTEPTDAEHGEDSSAAGRHERPVSADWRRARRRPR